MADATPITPCRGGASPFASEPCLAFGAAIQSLERLLQADTDAAGLPHGDPAHHNAPADADRAFDTACEALDHAQREGSKSLYREAAATMLFGLTASVEEDVRAAFVRLGGLALIADRSLDRTLRLSLDRARDVFQSLAYLWNVLETGPEPEVDMGDGTDEDIEWDDIRDSFDDPAALTPG